MTLKLWDSEIIKYLKTQLRCWNIESWTLGKCSSSTVNVDTHFSIDTSCSSEEWWYSGVSWAGTQSPNTSTAVRVKWVGLKEAIQLKSRESSMRSQRIQSVSMSLGNIVHSGSIKDIINLLKSIGAVVPLEMLLIPDSTYLIIVWDLNTSL
jgi:hypothetical protein